MKLQLSHRLQGTIARETARTTAVLGLRTAVQAGTLLLVARLLGPSQFGLFAGVTSLAILLGLLGTLGSHLVLLGEVAKDHSAKSRIMDWALPTTLACTIALLLIFIAACRFILPQDELPRSFVVAIGLSELIFQPLTVLFTVQHHALGKPARTQALQILPSFLRFLAVIAIVMAQPLDPLTPFGICYLAAAVLTLMIATRLVPSALPLPSAWRLPSAADLQLSAGYAVLNLTAAGPGEVDKTLAARLLAPFDAGIYSGAARVLAAGILPITAMSLAAMPRMFREGQRRYREASQLLWKLYGTGLAYGICLAGLLWMLAPAADWLFGREYEGISSAIRVLCMAVPGIILRRINGTVLMTMGKPWIRVAFEASGIATLLVAAVLLSGHHGIGGMFTAVILSEWSMVLLGGFLIHRQMHDETKGGNDIETG